MKEAIWEGLAFWNNPHWELGPATCLLVAGIYFFIEYSSLTGWPEGWEKVPSMVEDREKSVKDAWRAFKYLICAIAFSFLSAWILSATGLGVSSSFWWVMIFIVLHIFLNPLFVFLLIGIVIWKGMDSISGGTS